MAKKPCNIEITREGSIVSVAMHAEAYIRACSVCQSTCTTYTQCAIIYAVLYAIFIISIIENVTKNKCFFKEGNKHPDDPSDFSDHCSNHYTQF